MVVLLLALACGPGSDGKDSGDPGETGDTGDSGETGDSGDSAETGDSGDTDETGDSGDTDDSGDSGDTGETGDTAPRDADGDGFLSDVDCDDGDPGVNPDADEVCGDGVDQDCVPSPDCALSGTYSLGAPDALIGGSGRNDLLGHDLARAGDTDGDGREGLWVASAWNDEGGADAGTLYLLEGDLRGATDLSVAVARLFGEEPGDKAAGAMDGGVDLDGDGAPDVLVGASQSARNDGAGAAYALYGPFSGEIDLGTAPRIWEGEAAGDRAGAAVALLPDVDGDGRGEVVIAAVESDRGGEGSGAVYFDYDATAGSLAEVDAIVAGEEAGDDLGYALARLGDTDGDGLSDVLLGAPGHDAGGTNAGAAYLILSPLRGSVDLSFADAKLVSEAAQDATGFQVADAGDVDGDGYADAYVASPNHDEGTANAGAVYLVRGPMRGVLSLSGASAKYVGINGFVGTSVASAGDVNGDGTPDLVTGARDYDDGTGVRGGAWLVYQPQLGVVSLAGADATFVGADAGDQAGDRVTGAGDLDGDGRDDLAFNSTYGDAGAPESGEVAIFFAVGE